MGASCARLQTPYDPQRLQQAAPIEVQPPPVSDSLARLEQVFAGGSGDLQTASALTCRPGGSAPAAWPEDPASQRHPGARMLQQTHVSPPQAQKRVMVRTPLATTSTGAFTAGGVLGSLKARERSSPKSKAGTAEQGGEDEGAPGEGLVMVL